MGPARSKNLGTHGVSMRENREVPCSPVPLMVGAGREGNADGGNPLMHDRGKSDGPVVPTKLPSNAALAVAEVVEGQGPGRWSSGIEDVAYRVIAAHKSPLTRRTRFVQHHQDASAEVFAWCWGCVRRPGWSRSRWSRSTAATSRPTRAAKRKSLRALDVRDRR